MSGARHNNARTVACPCGKTQVSGTLGELVKKAQALTYCTNCDRRLGFNRSAPRGQASIVFQVER